MTADRTEAGRRGAQLRVWTCPERVVDGREGQSERDEGRDGEDLRLVETGVPQPLDVPDLDGVRVGCDGSSPIGERPFAGVQIFVRAPNDRRRNLGSCLRRELLAPGQRAIGVTQTLMLWPSRGQPVAEG